MITYLIKINYSASPSWALISSLRKSKVENPSIKSKNSKILNPARIDGPIPATISTFVLCCRYGLITKGKVLIAATTFFLLKIVSGSDNE